MAIRFRNRADAGQRLARELRHYAGRRDVLILALPRGGVPVAAEVARALGAPLEVFVVRKLGVPGHPEFAMGALASGGVRLLDTGVIGDLGITAGDIERATAVERLELERRERSYRGSRAFPDLHDRTVIVVDDGLATGSTMSAAVAALREEGASRIVVAVPVAATDTCERLRRQVDEVICATTPEPFLAVGRWYEDFSETTDEEVHQLLAQYGGEAGEREREVRIVADRALLGGTLAIPDGATGVALFAHGSGSSRFSPRNIQVARTLQEAGLGTLLMDLLTENEARLDAVTRHLRFDIGLLAARLAAAIDWLGQEPETHALSIGLFGASTGAAAALVAASRRSDAVHAIVSRGGRPDLAGVALGAVRAPTLLIVGSLDDPVIGLNRQAMAQMRVERRLDLIEGASHLFEEPGTLEEAAHLARDWFLRYLTR